MSLGSTRHRCRLTKTFGSPGAGSMTAVRSSTAVTHTRLPSTTAGKSGRMTTSGSVVTWSRDTSRSASFSDMTERISHLSRTMLWFCLETIGASTIWTSIRTPARRSGSWSGRFDLRLRRGGGGSPERSPQSPAVLVREPRCPEQRRRRDDEGEELRRQHVEELPAVATEQPPDLQEGRRPDDPGGRDGEHEQVAGNLEHPREPRQDDPHAGDQASQHDGPRSPATKGMLRRRQALLVEAEVLAEANQEGMAEVPGQAVETEAPRDRPTHHGQEGERVRDVTGGGEKAPESHRHVARRR